MLINTARGEVLPLADLVQCLKEGLIKAAALDVLEQEPIAQLADIQQSSYKYLVNSSNVLLSPHVAGWSRQSYRKISETLASKIIALVEQGLVD